MTSPISKIDVMYPHSIRRAAVPRRKILASTTLSPIVLATALLSGCSSLAPSYERPTAPVASEWRQAPAQATSASTSANALPWRELYTDPKLQTLIQTALNNNRDLRVAALNIEKARAQYHIQRAALFPEINASGGYSAQRTPASVSTTGSSVISRAYSLEVGVTSYELDLFGRVRNLQDQALQSYLATEETRRATHISLISEVAGAYLSLAADLDSLRLAQETLATRQTSYDLQQERTQIGNSSQLDLRQAEGELEAARAELLDAQQQVELDRNTLELLAGTPLSDDLLPQSGMLAQLLGSQQTPAGLPSQLLQNRPDILSAEHTLIGAYANIGAARAAFFPSISLTTSLGRASDDLSGLFKGSGTSWSFIPQVNLPIFTAGRLKSELEVSKVERDIALAQYEQAIQTAFREVADALAKRAVVDGQLQAQRKRVAAAQDSFDLVQLRYDNGVASHLDVLDAQRTLYSAQKSAIQAELAQQSSRVTLYKVLGGGWQELQASDHARATALD